MNVENISNLTVDRFDRNPLISPETDDRIGSNINGPSVIRVPDWIDDPLGEYYLYFGHHSGAFIRLAYADDIRGPWTVYTPGTLSRNETQFDNHIASPDVHVDNDEERIRMYFHGCCGPFEHASGDMGQVTDVATSTDGLEFTVRGRTLGESYFRVWEYDGAYYALANDGHLYRSENPLAPFERLHEVFTSNRHFAVRFVDDDCLQLFLTRRGDYPERVMVTQMDLSRPVEEWEIYPDPPETVLWPMKEYEGGDLQPVPSENGPANDRERALRDPALFEEDGRLHLFYAVAGESGIGGGEISET